MKIINQKTNENLPHLVDVTAGKNIRKYRLSIGISQEELGKRIGLTFQQIQKYEKGENRISLSRLFELTKALDLDIKTFIDNIFASMSQNELKLEEEQVEYSNNIDKNEILSLVRFYSSVKNQDVRKKILSLIKSMSLNN